MSSSNSQDTGGPVVHDVNRPVVAVRLIIMRQTKNAAPVLLFMATSEADYPVVLPHEVAGFLLEHNNHLLACDDAGHFHWVVDQLLANLPEARSVLWNFSRTHRLADVELLGQLVELAEAFCRKPRKLDLNEIAGRYSLPLENLEEIGRAVLAAKANTIPDLPEPLVERARRSATILLSLYDALYRDAQAAAESAGFETDADSAYGVLGLGLQVQARIASTQPHSPARFDQARLSEALPTLETEKKLACDEIAADPVFANCFKGYHDGFFSTVMFKKRKLEPTLVGLLNRVVCRDGTRPAMMYEEGHSVPFKTDEWGLQEHCDPSLNRWVVLDTLCQQIQLARKCGDGPITITHEVVPRIRSLPKPSILRRTIEEGWLQSAPGSRLCVLRFTDLSFRALGAWCDHHFGNSSLAASYRAHQDPIELLAQQLPTHFAQLRMQEPGSMETSQTIAKYLLSAMSVKLSLESLRQLFELKLNLELSVVEATELEQVAFQLYPELRRHCEDMAEHIAGHLAVRREDIDTMLSTSHRVGEQIEELKRLRSVPDIVTKHRSGLFAEPPDLSSLEWHQMYQSRAYRLPTGRLRGPSIFAEANAEHLDWADDAVKAALYELVFRGGEVLACVQDLIAIRIPSCLSDPLTGDEACQVAATAATGVLGVPVRVTLELCDPENDDS